MADKFDVLVAKVQELSTVADSTVAFIDDLKTQLTDGKDDPAQIQAIVDGLEASKQKIVSAIVAGTDAEGETTTGTES